MNFIWLNHSLREGEKFAATRSDVTVFESCEQVLASGPTLRGTILEFGSSDDVEATCDLINRLHRTCPVWVYQPAATVNGAVWFMKAGATHVATSFTELDDCLTDTPMRAASTHPKRLVGDSPAMDAISTAIDLVANRHCNVLIEGETGTGKEVVAAEIHRRGNRSRGPWVPVNCAAIPETLLEAELFGHVKGAFTGAVQARPGKFEAANQGTIFLDEIGEMPLAVQTKLLRVLQEKEIERLGGNERIRLDVRVIAATNRNLAELVEAGLFRQDLYYRLNVFQISLPPLRERPDDIPQLARHFVEKICAGEKLPFKNLDRSAIDTLMAHNWPGNARELENAIETAIILSGSRSNIYSCDLRSARAVPIARSAPKSVSPSDRVSLPVEGLDYQQALERFELDLLTQAIARTRGNKTAAADLLRLKRTTLSARMRVLESRLPRLVA